jgi:hypothetical protein
MTRSARPRPPRRVIFQSLSTACGSSEQARWCCPWSCGDVTDFLDVPLASVVLPEYAPQNNGSAVSLGAIMGAVAAGAFVGMLLFGAVGRRQPRRLTFIVSLVVGAVDPDATCCDPRAQGYRGRFANWAAKSRI